MKLIKICVDQFVKRNVCNFNVLTNLSKFSCMGKKKVGFRYIDCSHTAEIIRNSNNSIDPLTVDFLAFVIVSVTPVNWMQMADQLVRLVEQAILAGTVRDVLSDTLVSPRLQETTAAKWAVSYGYSPVEFHQSKRFCQDLQISTVFFNIFST